MTRQRLGVISAVAFIGTVLAANWAVTRFGLVPVGFGLIAPAGVYFVGIAFTLRDLIQETLGRVAVIVCILIGAILSAFVSERLAMASVVAFLVAELVDFAIYTPMRQRGWLLAVVASNVVALVLDSILFLWLAFGSLDHATGQFVGKSWMTLLAILLLLPWRKRILA